MAWLESLAQGMRGAGGILDQNVYQEGLRDERLKEVEISRRRDLIAQQVIRGAEAGAIPPEAAQATLAKLGYGNLPIGPSLQAQAQQEAIKAKQREMMEQEQANQYLGALRQRMQAAMQPRVTTDAADNVMQEPGMSRDEALRSVLPDMILHQNRFIADRGAGLEKSLEATEARRETVAAALQQRALEAERNHLARMQMLQTAEARVAETQRHNQVMEGLRAAIAANGRSGGGAGGRREPFKFSVEGENVQGWRDRSGQVTDASGRVITNYQPEVTASDQAASQKRVQEQETLASIDDKLNRINRINASNPALTSGVAGSATNALAWMYNQTLGHAMGYTRSPNEQAKQLRDFVISEMGGLGRLSNQDRQRIEEAWSLNAFGSAQGVEEAVKLTRQLINSKYAGSGAPVARQVPGGQPPRPSAAPATPPPPPGFKVD